MSSSFHDRSPDAKLAYATASFCAQTARDIELLLSRHGDVNTALEKIAGLQNAVRTGCPIVRTLKWKLDRCHMGPVEFFGQIESNAHAVALELATDLLVQILYSTGRDIRTCRPLEDPAIWFNLSDVANNYDVICRYFHEAVPPDVHRHRGGIWLQLSAMIDQEFAHISETERS